MMQILLLIRSTEACIWHVGPAAVPFACIPW